MIINRALIRQAIEFARPSAEALLAADGMTWGPKVVDGFIRAPGLLADEIFTFGTPDEGEYAEGFWDLAAQKINAAHENGDETGIISNETPWLLKDGQNLYLGGVHYEGISVSASGANEEVDEGIAYIILDLIVMLAKREAKRRRTSGNEKDMII
jgi:hypothetical protein